MEFSGTSIQPEEGKSIKAQSIIYISLLPSINVDSNIKFAGFLPFLTRFSFLGTVVLNKLSSLKLPSMYKIESALHQDGPWR